MWLNLSINDQNGGKPNGLVNVGELSKFIEKLSKFIEGLSWPKGT